MGRYTGLMARRKIKRVTDFGQTSNFQKAGTMRAKTLAVKTVVLNVKPTRYSTTGRL